MASTIWFLSLNCETLAALCWAPISCLYYDIDFLEPSLITGIIKTERTNGRRGGRQHPASATAAATTLCFLELPWVLSKLSGYNFIKITKHSDKCINKLWQWQTKQNIFLWVVRLSLVFIFVNSCVSWKAPENGKREKLGFEPRSLSLEELLCISQEQLFSNGWVNEPRDVGDSGSRLHLKGFAQWAVKWDKN